MKAINFSYNGLLASDFGLMICKFDNSEGFNTIEVGSELSLDTISLFNGNKYLNGRKNHLWDKIKDFRLYIERKKR